METVKKEIATGLKEGKLNKVKARNLISIEDALIIIAIATIITAITVNVL